MKNSHILLALVFGFTAFFLFDSCTPEEEENLANFRRGNPEANAGPDMTITLPVSTVVLKGSGKIPNWIIGNPIGISKSEWTQFSGNDATIVTPVQTFPGFGPDATIETSVTGLTISKRYTFLLTVTDRQGDQANDTVHINVLPAAANQPPLANAGRDTSITLPVSSISLTGSGTDPEGGILTYQWSLAGGTGAVIENPSTAFTNITGLVTPGDYVFRFIVTDDKNAKDTSDVTIKVFPPSINSFKVDTTNYFVHTTRQIRNRFETIARPVNSPLNDGLMFTFFSDTSFPKLNTQRFYNIVPLANQFNQVQIFLQHARFGNNNYHYFGTGTDGVVVDVENRNGKLYIKMPGAIAAYSQGTDVDTVTVSATVHDLN